MAAGIFSNGIPKKIAARIETMIKAINGLHLSTDINKINNKMADATISKTI
jgi:hypothetical protein